jgi:hypothetical protein
VLHVVHPHVAWTVSGSTRELPLLLLPTLLLLLLLLLPSLLQGLHYQEWDPSDASI